MAFDLGNIFGKSSSNPDQDLLNELGLDESTLSEKKDRSKQQASEILKKLTQHVEDNKAMILVAAYMTLGIWIVGGLGGGMTLQASLQTQTNVRDENKKSLEKLEAEIAKIKPKEDIAAGLDTASVADVIKKLNNYQIPWSESLATIKKLQDEMIEKGLAFSVNTYSINGADRSITINGVTEGYAGYQKIVEAIANQEFFTKIELVGSISRDKDKKVSVNLKFVYDDGILPPIVIPKQDDTTKK